MTDTQKSEKYLAQAVVCGITALVHFAAGDFIRSTRWGKVADAYRRKADKIMKGGLHALHN
jgi:hypothetical protein